MSPLSSPSIAAENADAKRRAQAMLAARRHNGMRNARRERRLTIPELSVLTGISETRLYRFEAGRMDIDRAERNRIGDVLGLRGWEL